jgi:hypothetical protein
MAWGRVFAIGALLLVVVEFEKSLRRWTAKDNGR